MKRCPTCNKTFDEDWLAFCTQDGTTLIEDSVSKNEPPPTIMSSGPPPPVPAPPTGWNQPSGGFGSGQFPESPMPAPPPAGNWNQPSGGFGSGQFPEPQPIQSGWQPPPPPSYAGPTQGLAVASMICGIFSVTIGWCCYLGVITSPVAIGLGIYSLNQIKNYPDKFTGKPFAITGIVTGSIYFLLLALIILIYGVAVFMGGVK